MVHPPPPSHHHHHHHHEEDEEDEDLQSQSQSEHDLLSTSDSFFSTEAEARDDPDYNPLDVLPSPPPPLKKSVRFAEYACVHLYNPPTTTLASTWYSPKELKSFRDDTRRTIELIVASGNNIDDSDDENTTSSSSSSSQQSHPVDSFCARGCESRTPMGSIVRNKHRVDSLRAVFKYQDTVRIRQQLQRYKQHRRLPSDQSTQQRSSVRKQDDVDHVIEMDHNVIARLYEACTSQSRQMAYVMGQIDQANALPLVGGDGSKERRWSSDPRAGNNHNHNKSSSASSLQQPQRSRS
jgi:hypothetical protein